MLKNPNYVYGSRNVTVPVGINFPQFILDRMSAFREKVALVNGTTDDQITYGEMLQQTIDLSISLAQLGVRKGQTVAICSENRVEFLPAVIASSCTGAVVSPISDSYSKDEMKHVLSICRPQHIICSPTMLKKHIGTWKSLHYLIKVIVFGNEKPSYGIWYTDLINKGIKYEDFTPVDVEGQTDTLFILYSSGTTGLPKGVMISHYNGLVCCGSFSTTPPPDELTASLTVAPWYHAMGLWGFMATITNGRRMIYLPEFTERGYLRAIHKHKPAVLAAPPPVVVMLAKSTLLKEYELSSVLLIFCGAAPLDEDTIAEVSSRLPNLLTLMQGYGLTESTLAVSRDSPELSPAGVKPKSTGVVIPGSVVKIVDVNTREPLGINQHGEICVKGATMMQGYVGRKRSEYFDKEGFYATGDIGYFDEDKYLYIVDRLKELIKFKGYQVPPAELEAVLLQHPAVRDAGVVGKPDKSAGELPMAFVVKQPGCDVTEQELIDFVASKVSKQKQLRGGVKFVAAIPKNPSGKILRKVLREWIKNGNSKL